MQGVGDATLYIAIFGGVKSLSTTPRGQTSPVTSICRASHKILLAIAVLPRMRDTKRNTSLFRSKSLPMEDPHQDNFEITTSIRSDGLLVDSLLPSLSGLEKGSFYMLRLHQERMLTALSTFKWPQVARDALLNLREHLVDHLKQKYDDPCYGVPLKVSLSGCCLVSNPLMTHIAARNTLLLWNYRYYFHSDSSCDLGYTFPFRFR